MTTPQKPGVDPHGDAEVIEDLPVPADTAQQVAGGDFVITKRTDAASSNLMD